MLFGDTVHKCNTSFINMSGIRVSESSLCTLKTEKLRMDIREQFAKFPYEVAERVA
jgi:hypothetical protein